MVEEAAATEEEKEAANQGEQETKQSSIEPEATVASFSATLNTAKKAAVAAVGSPGEQQVRQAMLEAQRQFVAAFIARAEWIFGQGGG